MTHLIEAIDVVKEFKGPRKDPLGLRHLTVHAVDGAGIAAQAFERVEVGQEGLDVMCAEVIVGQVVPGVVVAIQDGLDRFGAAA